MYLDLKIQKENGSEFEALKKDLDQTKKSPGNYNLNPNGLTGFYSIKSNSQN